MQTFNIEVEDVQITPILIKSLLQDYFNKLPYKWIDIIVKEVKDDCKHTSN